MRKLITIVLTSALLLGGCGQTADTGSDRNAAANAAAAAKKPRPKYCFFKEAETKSWAAKRGKDGNIIVKGKAYRSDSRYKSVLEQANVSGQSATISPTIVINDSTYGAPGDWWDVEAVIPSSAAVETVTVTCGARTLATLSVRRSK